MTDSKTRQASVPLDELEAEIQRGWHAKELMDDEMLKDAFAKVDASFRLEWLNGKTVAEREEAHARTLGLSEVAKRLRVVLQNGRIAEQHLKELRDKDARRAQGGYAHG